MFIRRICAAIIFGAVGVSVGLVASRTVFGADNPIASADKEQANMDKLFFDMAASGNTFEIRAAKLAEDRATDSQVKQVAEMMQHDHEQANQLLGQIAGKYHIDASLDTLTPVDEATLKELQEMQGDLFTRMYLFEQIGKHAQDELVFSYHATKGSSEACKDYSTQVLATVQKHLHALEAIARPMAGLNAEAQAAGSKLNPDMK